LLGIKTAAAFRNRDLACKFILHSAAWTTCSVKEYSRGASRIGAADYHVAHGELRCEWDCERAGGFQSPQAATKLEALSRTFDNEFIEPLLRDTMSASDPIERSLLLVEADVVGHLHRSTWSARRRTGLPAACSREPAAPGVL